MDIPACINIKAACELLVRSVRKLSSRLIFRLYKSTILNERIAFFNKQVDRSVLNLFTQLFVNFFHLLKLRVQQKFILSVNKFK